MAAIARAAGMVALMMVCACTQPEDVQPSDGTWVGTITTEGNVTTVVNESGSVWVGTATLVEEASIGVESGEDVYMLASVTSVTATDDRIYVLERLPAVVRVYDFDGTHIMDIGRSGQGPGEFSRPMSVVVDPAGRVLVRDGMNARITVFADDGELLDTWPLGSGYMVSRQSLIAADGTYYSPAPVARDEETNRSIWGYLHLSATGEEIDRTVTPELDYEPPRLSAGSMSASVPYYPFVLDELTPSGAWILAIGDRYRFEVRQPGGSITIIERPNARPVPIGDEEREWETRAQTASLLERDPSFTWNGPPIPDHMPFLQDFYPDYSGRIWVQTNAPSLRADDCTEDPLPGEPLDRCWIRRPGLDVFDADGRYLGGVEVPEEWGFGLFSNNYFRDDIAIKAVMDEAGTIMVKRYRLVVPGEQ